VSIRVHPCFNPLVKIITHSRCTEYYTHGHPERPARISGTARRLSEQTEIELNWTQASRASDASILRAHSPEHIARLHISCDFDSDTPHHDGIEEHARASAGAALDALKFARAGETVFSLMRPPGHHATRDEAMGFCYLSNIAIATLEALATGTKRVAVFDFDVHHGNGTEAILINQPGAAFFSIHQYPCYPGTGESNVGNNCFNYPVAPHTPRESYRNTLSQALDDLKRFKPELVAVSAGFDAYAHDPIAQETLEAEDFHWLGGELRKVGVPMFSLLEGGYSDDLPQLIMAYLKGVIGK